MASKKALPAVVDRTRGIGASEMGAIAGLDPFRTRIQVWEQKTGRAEPKADNHHLKRGRYLENGILAWLGDEAGQKIQLARNEDGVQPSYPGPKPYIWATPDALVLGPADVPIGVAEAKAPHRTWRDWFDDKDTFIVPDAIVCQVTMQMICVRAQHPTVERALVGATIDGDLGYKWIGFDKSLAKDLMAIAAEFWALVESDTPPAPDGSEAYTSFLARRFPHAAREMMDLGQLSGHTIFELGMWAGKALDARDRRDAGERDFERYKNLLKMAMGDAGAIHIPDTARVTWTNNKDESFVDWQELTAALFDLNEEIGKAAIADATVQVPTTDWEKVARALLARQPEEKREEFLAKHTIVNKGVRVFRIKQL